MNNTLYLCAAVFVAGALLGGLIVHKAELCRDTVFTSPTQRSVTVTDTVTVEKFTVLEKIKPLFTIDTVWVTGGTIGGDSTEDRVVSNPIFEAGVDTVMFNSTLKLGVRYTSPVPLDSRGYFTLRAALNERTITEKETVFLREEEGWFSRWLHFGVVLAPGYGLIEKKADIFVGVGIMVGL